MTRDIYPRCLRHVLQRLVSDVDRRLVDVHPRPVKKRNENGGVLVEREIVVEAFDGDLERLNDRGTDAEVYRRRGNVRTVVRAVDMDIDLANIATGDVHPRCFGDVRVAIVSYHDTWHFDITCQNSTVVEINDETKILEPCKIRVKRLNCQIEGLNRAAIESKIHLGR